MEGRRCASIMREEEGEWRGRQCEYSEGEACRVSGWRGRVCEHSKGEWKGRQCEHSKGGEWVSGGGDNVQV